MSRELILIKKCDLCQREDDNVDVPATVTYTVGIVEGESRPVPKVLDLCDDHAGPLADLLAVMADIHQLPGDTPAKAKPAKAKPAKARRPGRPGAGAGAADDWQCPVCHEWLRGNPVSHIYQRHRTDRRPLAPTTCPDCGKAYRGGAGMSAHRRYVHGFDVVADALSGVPGYQPPKPAKVRKQLPQPEQMELTGT